MLVFWKTIVKKILVKNNKMLDVCFAMQLKIMQLKF